MRCMREWPIWISNILALVVLLPACDSSPAAPTTTQYPDVAGTYSGPLVAEAVLEAGLTQTLNGTMRIVVTQSGPEVTVSGSFTLLGETEEIPPYTGRINEAGEFTFPDDIFEDGALNNSDCGEITVTSMSIAFSSDTATFTYASETAACGDFNFRATMTKE